MGTTGVYSPVSGTARLLSRAIGCAGLCPRPLASKYSGSFDVSISPSEPSSSHYPVVALAAASGARRNELLALRWSDLDEEKQTLRIERAWEQTKKFGLRLKPPKTKRGLRTISLDAATVAMLLAEKERHLRIKAGIPDGVM
jgi:hypothetical protein